MMLARTRTACQIADPYPGPMRALALVMWNLAAVWIVLALFGAENFQELYGGTSGIQFLALAALTALIPAVIGWWAWRRHKTREG
jgi:hypothetical protein